MTLEEYIHSLPKDRQSGIAIRLTKLALPIWEQYAAENELTYRDTVVGLHHAVDKNLLKNTIEAVEKYISANKVGKAIIKTRDLYPLSKQFGDPITALQDLDWELPNEVEKTFYAIHNLLDAVIGKGKTVFNEVTIYVTINQAIEALIRTKLLAEAGVREVLYGNRGGRENI